MFEWRFNLKTLENNLLNIGESLATDFSFDGDALFLKGDKSDYIQMDDELLIHKHFINSSVVEIKNAGHWLHAENPTQFYDEVILFLQK